MKTLSNLKVSEMQAYRANSDFGLYSITDSTSLLRESQTSRVRGLWSNVAMVGDHTGQCRVPVTVVSATDNCPHTGGLCRATPGSQIHPV